MNIIADKKLLNHLKICKGQTNKPRLANQQDSLLQTGSKIGINGNLRKIFGDK